MSLASSPSMVYHSAPKPLRFFQMVKAALKKIHVTRAYHFTEHLQKSQTLFYIGVYSAEQLYSLAMLTGPGVKLVIFTPAKDSYDELMRLSEILQLTNVTIVLITFSAMEDDAVLPSRSQNGVTVIDLKYGKYYTKDELPGGETIDNYCVCHNIHPHLLEIKLPGNELAVLKGARETLKRYKPKLIIECDQSLSGTENVTQVSTFLKGIKYRNFFIFNYLHSQN